MWKIVKSSKVSVLYIYIDYISNSPLNQRSLSVSFNLFVQYNSNRYFHNSYSISYESILYFVDLIPYVQYGTSVAFHHNLGVAIQKLKDTGQSELDLDCGLKEPFYEDLEFRTKFLYGLLSST